MVCQNKSSNLTRKESLVRLFLGIGLVILTLYFQSVILLIMAIALILNAFFQKCYFYELLGINKEIKKQNSFFYSLPKYNPQPVFVLDKEFKFIYQNDASFEIFNKFKNEEITKYFQSLFDLDTLKKNKNATEIQYKFDENNIYLFEIIYELDLDLILVYATNITNVIKAEQEIVETQKDIIYRMGEIGETRSKETGNHVKRVAKYSELLALKYGLSQEDAELLKFASPMHDIGKVGIEDGILKKPGKLTPQEFEIMKTHAELGFNMLKSSDKPILKAASIVAHEHHEKWDGSGYPRGLKGEEIHIFGRITAVADVFDALGSERCYKKAWELDDIFKLFKEQSGKHFDPKLIDLFFENFDEFDKIRLEYKD